MDYFAFSHPGVKETRRDNTCFFFEDFSKSSERQTKITMPKKTRRIRRIQIREARKREAELSKIKYKQTWPDLSEIPRNPSRETVMIEVYWILSVFELMAHFVLVEPTFFIRRETIYSKLD
jgi:hypothetical protein